MENIIKFLLPILSFLPYIGIAFFIWGIVDNYFLIRYGGKLNRGFTVWKKVLTGSERHFLLNLSEDIVEKTKIGIGRTKTNFFAKQGDAVLIRYSNPGQKTSWPIVFYVDLSTPQPMMEYRFSLPMFLGTLLISSLNIIVFIVLLVAFVISWIFETSGTRNYLSKKTDLYFAKKLLLNQKGSS